MGAWTIEILFYGALAIGVTWLSRRHALAIVGITLCLCALVTNVAYFGSSLGSRVTLEIIQAVVLMNSARMAFNARPSAAAAIVTGFAAIDVAFCGAVALVDLDPRWASFIFGWVTNGVFAIQCLCVATPGVRDAFMGRRDPVGPLRGLDHADISMDALYDKVGKL